MRSLSQQWDVAWSRPLVEQVTDALADCLGEPIFATFSLGLHRVEPFWHERFGVSRGRRIDEADVRPAPYERHRLDAWGRVRVFEEFEAESGDPFVVEVHAHGQDVSRAARWVRGELQSVREVRSSGGLVRLVSQRQPVGMWTERYHHDAAGRVVVIDAPQGREEPDGVKLGARGLLDVAYLENGSLREIVVRNSGRVLYRLPDAPLHEMLERAAERVAADIPRWLEALSLGHPVSAVLLVYGDSTRWCRWSATNRR